jgi:hypothetical protein
MGHSQVSLQKRKHPLALTDRTGEATRHLCAGMYLEREFRNTVIRQVHNHPHHGVAPSYGFDLVPVVMHAWRAWTLEVAQDACVLSVLVIGYVSNPPVAITAASGIGLWHLGRQMLRTVPVVLKLKAQGASDRWLNRQPLRPESPRLEEMTRLLRISAVGCVLMVALPLLSTGAQHVPLREAMWMAAFLLLLIAGVVITAGVFRQQALDELRTVISQHPLALSGRQRDIEDQQDDRLVVFQRPEPKDETDVLRRVSAVDEDQSSSWEAAGSFTAGSRR